MLCSSYINLFAIEMKFYKDLSILGYQALCRAPCLSGAVTDCLMGACFINFPFGVSPLCKNGLGFLLVKKNCPLLTTYSSQESQIQCGSCLSALAFPYFLLLPNTSFLYLFCLLQKSHLPFTRTDFGARC